MLSKLLKHEFIATGRVMWIIYVAVLALSIGANVSMRVLNHLDIPVLNAVSIVILIFWVLSLIGGVAAALVLMVRRFQKNLLTDEGYLMFTLPANVHQLVISKMLVAAVWFMVSFLVVALGVLIATLNNDTLIGFGEVLQDMFRFMDGTLALNAVAIFVEFLVLVFVGCAVSSLQFYSAMSIGHGFTSHKVLWSVVFYFIQDAAIQLISWICLLCLGMSRLEIGLDLFFDSVPAMTAVHASMGTALVLELILGTIYYVLTTVNLKKRLNLA